MPEKSGHGESQLLLSPRNRTVLPCAPQIGSDPLLPPGLTEAQMHQASLGPQRRALSMGTRGGNARPLGCEQAGEESCPGASNKLENNPNPTSCPTSCSFSRKDPSAGWFFAFWWKDFLGDITHSVLYFCVPQ